MSSPPTIATRAAGVVKGTAVAGAWGVIGSTVGSLILVAAPQLITHPGGFVAGCGALMSALYGIGLLRPFRVSPLKDIEADLLEADGLFVRGQIDDVEYRNLRKRILGRYR